jgi:hypothetical protein
MKNLCTLFDSRYMPLGMALYESIVRNFSEFHLWVLALDDEAYRVLRDSQHPHMTVIALTDIESSDVLEAKSNRTWQEFCWTLSPVLPTYIIEKNPHLAHITYIDSDIYFYSDAQPIYDEIGESSIMITPHRFPDRLKHLEQNGIYNVQMVYFKNDRTGRACLAKWREQCLEWCYYRLEPDRMGDQKYLDKWPNKYPNVCILENIGAGAAVWNIENYAVKHETGSIWLNEFPLIFYHFHGFKFFSGGFFTSSLVGYGLQLSLLDSIYRPYVSEITDICSKNRFTGKGLTLREILKFMSARNLHHNQKVIRVALNFMSWLLGLLKR